MRVLGLDPGIAVFGFGLLERDGGKGPRLVEAGVWRPREHDEIGRLLHLFDRLEALLAAGHPDLVAVERVFHTRNVSTAISVGQARGVALLACARAGLPVAEFTPTEMKLAVAGYGGADKQQVQRMVALQLGLAEIPRPDDAADALGLGLCGLFHEQMRQRLGGAARRERS